MVRFPVPSFQVYLSDEEYSQLKEEADKLGLRVSLLVRKIIRERYGVKSGRFKAEVRRDG
jgi:hypothetical protein